MRSVFRPTTSRKPSGFSPRPALWSSSTRMISSPFPFSFRAFRSAPGGKVRSLGAPREPSRAGGLGRGRRVGRSRWRRENREPVAVVGRAAAGRPGFGRRAFPRRQRQFRSGRAKKQATKRRTKKDFPSPKRRRFVKTGFSARYKEARRSGRPRGRKSPARAKATAVVGFPASPWQTPGGAVGFPASP